MDTRCGDLEWIDVKGPAGSRCRLHMGSCPDCGSVTWLDDGSELDPAEAMERAFGSFELVAQLPALRAPGGVILAYRPPNRRSAMVLESLMPGRWLEGQPGLWMSTDTELLLLSPSDPHFADNLIRRA